MGKRDFDHDAEPIGANIVNTAQMSSDFRALAKKHLPTARETVVKVEIKATKDLAQSGARLSDIFQREGQRLHWIERQGGRAHVDRALSFATWFRQQLVNSSGDMSLPVTGQLALGSKPELFGTEWNAFLAHWSDTNVLTLAIDEDCFWQDPLGSKSLMILVHDASHARNMHHGKSFVEEVERLAGVAAAVMFAKHD